MKKQFFALSMTTLLMVCCCCGAAEGVVTASFLNARVFPELKSPAAVKLPRGKKVEIFKRHGAWLEIAAPDITPVYGSAAYLNGNVALRDMNLRIKPHSKAAVISRIKKGTVLKAVSEPDRYGWVQIAPLADMRLYVIRDYVSFDSAKVPVAQKATAPAPEKKAVPAPEKKAVPAPEKKAAPAPEKKAVPAPEKKAAPAPEKKAVPAPEKKAAPAPEKKAAPAPEKKAVPAPEKKAAPAPEKKAAPAPEKKAAPAPEKKAVPAPEKKAVPAPEKKAVPAPAPAAFDLLPQRKRELINIGADITRKSEYKQTGRLVAVPNPSGDCTTFALVNNDTGMNQGFIFAEAPIDLKKMLDKNVAVKGFAYKVAKWRNPVVCAVEVKVIGE